MSTGYFTDDITLMPIGVIWKSMSGHSILPRSAAFAYLLSRKLLRKRVPATHASHNPPKLRSVSQSDLCAAAMLHLSEADEHCRAAEMEFVGYFSPDWIGGKQGVLSIWVDQSRFGWSTTTWFEIRVGETRHSRVVFACHSETVNGLELHTAAKPSDPWFPDFIPPGIDVNHIPIDSNPAQVIATHFAGIQDRTDLAPMDSQSLVSHMEQRSLNQLRFMVSKGFYRELTKAEVENLQPARKAPGDREVR